MLNTLATLNILLVFTAILSTFSGFPMYSCDDNQNIEFKIYCSTNLSQALQLICGGKFYSFSKKFPQSLGAASSSPQGFFQESPLISKLVPDGFFQPLSANGTIHECCRRPCGYSELKLYCAND